MAKIDSGVEFNKDKNHDKLTKRMENLDTVQYPLRIPSSLYKQVKIKLANDNMKLRTVLIGMLEQYIKK